MYCMKCGEELPPEALFCKHCGLPVEKKGDEGESAVSEGAVRTAEPFPSASPAAVSGLGESEAEVELASVGRRLGAFLIDSLAVNVIFWTVCIVCILVFAAIDGSIDEDEVSDAAAVGGFIMAALASVGYYWFCNSAGASLGKVILAIRIRRLEDGTIPGPGWGLLRTIVAWFSGIPLYLGYLWAIWDDANQTWHDKAAGTVVIHRPETGKKIVLTRTKVTVRR